MGGKIGIETLLDNEKFFLAELIAYSSEWLMNFNEFLI